MSSQPTPQIVLTHFNWSLARFEETMENEDTEYYKGAALHRFMLTCSVALEAIRAFAKGQGRICSTEESCFQWVEDKHWLEKNANWNVMLEDYEKVKFSPKDKEVDNIYIKLKTYYILLSHLSKCMELEEK